MVDNKEGIVYKSGLMSEEERAEMKKKRLALIKRRWMMLMARKMQGEEIVGENFVREKEGGREYSEIQENVEYGVRVRKIC